MSVPPIAANEDELLDLVTHFDGTVTGMMMPEMAAALLKLNTNNRPMLPRGVARFKRILQDGGWLNTCEPVIVSREAVINDGQHRLAAIVETGIPAQMDVRFGIAREVFDATGVGRRRTPGDALHIIGASAAPTQAALARLLILFDAGRLGSKEAIEPSQIIAAVQKQPLISTIALLIQSTKFVPTRTAPFGFPLLLAAQASAMSKIEEFISIASTGLTNVAADPARVLHTRLADARMRRHRLPALTVATMTARAWNAWVEGREQKQLTARPGDETGENFPAILPWKDDK